MAAQKVRIHYNDGTEAEVSIKPRAQIETERHIGGDWSRMAILSVYHLAWSGLRAQDKNTPDFETWLDLVDDVEDLKEKDPDPTQPDPSTDSSSL